MQQQAQRRRWQLRQLAISAQSNDVAALSRSLLATSILERLGVSYAFRRCGGVLCCFFCRLFISTSAHSACASVRPSGGSSVDLSDGSLGTGRVVLRLETRRNASSFEELRPAFSVQLEDDQQVRRLLLTQTPARQPPILTAAQDPHPPPPPSSPTFGRDIPCDALSGTIWKPRRKGPRIGQEEPFNRGRMV